MKTPKIYPYAYALVKTILSVIRHRGNLTAARKEARKELLIVRLEAWKRGVEK